MSSITWIKYWIINFSYLVFFIEKWFNIWCCLYYILIFKFEIFHEDIKIIWPWGFCPIWDDSPLSDFPNPYNSNLFFLLIETRTQLSASLKNNNVWEKERLLCSDFKHSCVPWRNEAYKMLYLFLMIILMFLIIIIFDLNSNKT